MKPIESVLIHPKDTVVTAEWSPPSIKPIGIALQKLLGRGRVVELPAIEPGTRLTVRCADVSPPGDEAPVILSGAFGDLRIHQGVRMLRALTAIDITASDDPPVIDWLCASAAARLPAPLDQAFDRVALASRSSIQISQGETAAWSLRADDHVVTAHATASMSVWQRLIASGFKPLPNARGSAQHRLKIRWLAVAAVSILKRSELDTLGIGDLILPNRAWFDTDGNGVLHWANQTISVAYRDEGKLEVTGVERRAMNEDTDEFMSDADDEFNESMQNDEADHDYVEQHDDEDSGAEQATSPQAQTRPGGTSDVEVRVTFTLGTVSMTLAELDDVDIGSVMELRGPSSPPTVAINAGGTQLGSGLLVDVDGRLGIQVTDWNTP